MRNLNSSTRMVEPQMCVSVPRPTDCYIVHMAEFNPKETEKRLKLQEIVSISQPMPMKAAACAVSGGKLRFEV